MAKADVHQHAYDDYARALTLDPRDRPALHGLVRVAVLTKRGADALALIKSLTGNGGEGAALIASALVHFAAPHAPLRNTTRVCCATGTLSLPAGVMVSVMSM